MRLGLTRVEMIPCMCSLRSTQCAALIALATVAGIVRVAQPHPSTAAQSPQQSTAARASLSSNFYYYNMLAEFSRLAGSRPWTVFTASLTQERLAENDADRESPSGTHSRPSLPTPPPSSHHTEPSTRAVPVLYSSAKSHLIPFALGPPRGAATFKRWAVDPRTSCDSGRRSSGLRRIASVNPTRNARLARQDFPKVALLAARVSHPPGCALRGEPEASHFSS